MKIKKEEKAYNFDLSIEEIDNLTLQDEQSIQEYVGSRTVSSNVFESNYSTVLKNKNQEFKDLLADNKGNPKAKYLLSFFLIVLLLTSLMYVLQKSIHSEKIIFTEEIESYADNVINIDFINRIERKEEPTHSQALTFFQDKEYEQFLSSIETMNPDQNNLNLVSAYCHMKLGNKELVASQLSLIDVNNLFQPDLFYWISIWSELSNKRNQVEIHNMLDTIILNDYPSSDKALELKNKLLKSKNI